MKIGRKARWAIALSSVVATGLVVVTVLTRPVAPDVTFKTVTGKDLSMQSLRGKVVWVNFWATSCPTCIEEMPDLIDTYQRFKPLDFEVIAVAMSYDPLNYVVNYKDAAKLPFPVVADARGEVAQAFGNVSLTPTAILVDKQGGILKTIVGIPDFEEMHALLTKETARQ